LFAALNAFRDYTLRFVSTCNKMRELHFSWIMCQRKCQHQDPLPLLKLMLSVGMVL